MKLTGHKREEQEDSTVWFEHSSSLWRTKANCISCDTQDCWHKSIICK